MALIPSQFSLFQQLHLTSNIIKETDILFFAFESVLLTKHYKSSCFFISYYCCTGKSLNCNSIQIQNLSLIVISFFAQPLRLKYFSVSSLKKLSDDKVCQKIGLKKDERCLLHANELYPSLFSLVLSEKEINFRVADFSPLNIAQLVLIVLILRYIKHGMML